MKEASEKAGLKLTIQKSKIMAFSPITLWQIEGETTETVRLFFWAPKSLRMLTAAMKLRRLLLGRKAMTDLGSILKRIDITLPAKVHLVKAISQQSCMDVSWTIKLSAKQLMLLSCSVGEDSWTARGSNQSILEVHPEYSSGLTLKLKLSILWPPDAKNRLI